MPLTDNDDDKLVAVDQVRDDDGEVVKLDEDTPEKKVAAKVDAKTDIKLDERLSAKDDEDEAAPANETHEQKRERETQRERRERQRKAMERDKTELRFLRQRNEDLEKRQSTVEQRMLRGEYSTLDERISNIDENLRKADEVIAAAIEANAGRDAVEAQSIRDGLRQKRYELEQQKRQVAATAQQAQQQPAQRPDPRVVNHASEWTERNAWFDPSARDEDSAIAKVVDERLAAEGFNPATEEYWGELDKRLKQRLPHRYKTNGNGNGEHRETDQREERRDAGPRTPVANRQPALRPGEMYVSADRKQAMMDAGMWDDPVLRSKTLKRYADYDRVARESNGR